MRKLSGSPTPCGNSSKSVGMATKRDDRGFRKSWRGSAMPQITGIRTCLRVERNIERMLPRKTRVKWNTASSRFSYWVIVSLTFCAVGIFQTYKSDGSAVDPGTGALQLDNVHTALTQQNGVETHEEPSEPVYKHLDQNHRPPPRAVSPRKRKGFRAFIKKIFGIKPKH